MLLIRDCWLCRSRTCLDRREVGLQILQRINRCCLLWLCLLTFLIVAVTATLQFSWSHSAIGMLNKHWLCHDSNSTDTAKVHSWLHSWAVTKETRTESLRIRHTHSSVRHTLPDSVKSHDYTTVDILGCYKGKVKVLVSELKESDAAILGASALGWEAK